MTYPHGQTAFPSIQDCLAKIGALEARMASVESRIDAALRAAHSGTVQATRGKSLPLPAPDAWLNEPKNNIEIRRAPSKLAHLKGKRMADLSADDLTELAGFLVWCADKDDQKARENPRDAEAQKAGEYSKFRRRDAQLAMAWARRAEEDGRLAAQAGPLSDDEAARLADNDIPF